MNFLRGIIEVSQGATATTDAILDLQERHRQLVAEEMGNSVYALPLLDMMFEYPIFSIRLAEHRLHCNNVTAAKLVRKFESLGLLDEITGWKRNRLFRYGEYLDLFGPRNGAAAQDLEASAS